MQPSFLQLHSIVENLNTLRNIYVLFSSRLITKLAGSISSVYRQSLPYEDTVQVGSFGIARAAYRYHPSCGIRFSTYAAGWFYKEVQRQALSSRLVRISSNMVERYSQVNKRKCLQMEPGAFPQLSDAISVEDEDMLHYCGFENKSGHEHHLRPPLSVFRFTPHTSSGEEVIEFLRIQDIDLVILDMIMGHGLNSRETYEEIVTFKPTQKAVIATGFSDIDEVGRSLQLGVRGISKKPFTTPQLSVILRTALGAMPAA